MQSILFLTLLIVGSECFAPSTFISSKSLQKSELSLRDAPSCLKVCMQQGSSPGVDRRSALGIAAALFAGFANPAKNAQAAGLAFGYGASEQDVNVQLQAFSLPPIDKVPGGFKPLIQTIGGRVGANIDGSKVVESIGSYVSAAGNLKSGERLLLIFNYPSSWIVSLPISTPNGESGTVSANNYINGDTAVVTAKAGDGELATLGKEFFQDLLLQAVPKNQWQSFKIIKKTPATTADNAPCVDVEYKYDLITSGPEVGRRGFARCVRVGPLVVALGATTIDMRFKGIKDALATTAASFRSQVVKAEFSRSGLSLGPTPGTPDL